VGNLSIYLFPEEDVDPVAYGPRVKQALLAMKVIDDETYEHPNWWVAGESSADAFEDPSDETGFEYCIVYSSPFVELIPQDPAVFPKCGACGAEVSDEYYELVEDLEEKYGNSPALKGSQLLQASLRCPGCSAVVALENLVDPQGIYLKRTWVNFEDASGPLRDEWLKRFETATGWKHRAVQYWHT
jgi:hypothetical protein